MTVPSHSPKSPPAYSFPQVQPPSAAQQPNKISRRPQIWVPPIVAFATFTAGLAIPWEMGPDPVPVIFRVVVPLSLSAVFCLISGYYSYRTFPGWRIWTWIAFLVLMINALNFSFSNIFYVPVPVLLMLWLAVIGLGFSAGLGQEKEFTSSNVSNSQFTSRT